MRQELDKITRFRRKQGDAYYFNWLLKIDHDFQAPFEPTHENMAGLQLHTETSTTSACGQPPSRNVWYCRRKYQGRRRKSDQAKKDPTNYEVNPD